MIRCSSEAPPTPVHHTLPSSTGVWFHAPDPPTEEQNTAPGMFTPRDQQGQACSGASCSMCNIDLRGHWFWSIQKKKILLHCFSIYDIFWNKQKNSAIISFSPVLLLCFMDGWIKNVAPWSLILNVCNCFVFFNPSQQQLNRCLPSLSDRHAAVLHYPSPLLNFASAIGHFVL